MTVSFDIDINDYLGKDEIFQIVEDEFTYAVREQVRGETNIDRLVSNMSYEYLFSLISHEWGIDAVKELKETVHKVLMDEKSIRYEMFRDSFYDGDSEGPAVPMLKEACEELKPLIKEMAEKHIREYPFNELDLEEIQYTIGEVIMEALLDSQKNKEAENDS